MTRISMAAVAAASLAVLLAPTKASAEVIYYFTCNIDGYVYMDFTLPNGTAHHMKTPYRCGPDLLLAAGEATQIVVGPRTEIPSAGQDFLARIEKAGPGTVVRAHPADRARGAPVRTTIVRLHPDRVSPNLARLLTSADPKWKETALAPGSATKR